MSDQSSRAGWLSSLLHGCAGDVRFSLRTLAKSRGFAFSALLTLALCIGATTAIFSTVYSLMLKPLPFDRPREIVELYTSAKKSGLNHMPANIPFYLDYSKNATSYEQVGLWQFFQGMVGQEDAMARAGCVKLTAEIFQILRVQPVLGTLFTMEHCRRGEDMVIVLTQSCWENDFAQDVEVIGRQIRINEDVCTIIGVAPRAFEALDARVKYIQPLSWGPGAENPQARYGVGINLFGRLKPGVTAGQADAEAKTMEARYVEAGPPQLQQFVERSGMTMNVGGVQEQRVQPVRTTLLLLQGGVAFVLLIGCVNLANLLLARSNTRQGELAIRTALGASRGTIARQLLIESLLLTGTGAVLGLALAWGALRVTNSYLASMLPASLPATIDLRVLGFAVGLALLVGVLIGLVPIFHTFRTNLVEVIQRNARGSSAGRGVRALSSSLVVLQVAVALILLIGAGLLIHSFAKALNVSPGLNPEGIVTGTMALPRALRADPNQAEQTRQRLLQAMQEIPGVSSSALSFATPFKGGLPINAFILENDVLPPGAPQPGAFRVAVSPDYFKTLGLELLDGRFLEESDRGENAPRRYVVDASFARKFFPDRSAVDGRISFGGRPEKPEDWPSIVGVVKDVPHNGVEEKSGNPFIYELVGGNGPSLTVFMRTTRPAGDVLAVFREKLRAIDTRIALFDTGEMAAVLDSSYDNRRAVMLLLVAFAGLALFLSTLGIYSVLAYDVSQRTREIGVRGAIGASHGQIVGLILKQGLWKAGVGIVLGLIGALLLSRTMTSLLYETKPSDPIAYIVVSLLLLAVGTLASYLPARRAAKIDPLIALRSE
ncbi:MAG TPA: ABC transporter permease [Candidatus Synoicihabitans sp.]|nr:ABC transporter permease [Candidatus Synoicihabitans sp.]